MKTWPKVKLGDVCAINPKVQSPDAEALISVVPMSAVSETGEIDASAVQPFGDVSKGLTLFQEGDVLFAKITPCMENGKGAVAVGLRGGIGAGSTEFFVLRPDSKRVSSAWIYHFTKREAFRRLAAERMTGSGGQRRVPRVFLECVTLPLPPLEEQERIAAELDAVVATLKKRQAQLAELDALVEARFVELFGDPVTNPKAWPRMSLKQVSQKLNDGPFGSNLKSEHYRDSGVRVIRLQNIGVGVFLDSDKAYISGEHFQNLRKYACYPGDVIIGTLGVPNLRACLIPNFLEVAVNKADCVHCIPDSQRLLPLFLCSYLNYPSTLVFTADKIHGQTRSRISSGQVAQLPIFLPPLELQERFAAEVERVEAIKAKVRDGIAETQTLFDALAQKYFG